MNKLILACAFAAISSAALASGTYPSTLSPEERERHEFFDAQRGIRSGVEPVRPGDFRPSSRNFDRWNGGAEHGLLRPDTPVPPSNSGS